MPKMFKWNEILNRDSLPNNFTVLVGELIRKAREEKEMNQGELAKIIGRRQAALSDIENGKMLIDFITLLSICVNLDKPLSYFIPEQYRTYFPMDTKSPEGLELLMLFQRIGDSDLRQLALKQMKVIQNHASEQE